MIRILSMFAFTTAAALTTTSGEAGNSAKKEKAIPFYCPVAGLPEAKACGCPSGYCSLKPDPSLTIQYRGGKVQFCCAKCIDIFKKSPEKYSAVANHQLVATRQVAQIDCANCAGGKLYSAEQVIVEVAGIPVLFCSEACAKRVRNASPKERVELVFGDKAFTRAFVTKSSK